MRRAHAAGTARVRRTDSRTAHVQLPGAARARPRNRCGAALPRQGAWAGWSRTQWGRNPSGPTSQATRGELRLKDRRLLVRAASIPHNPRHRPQNTDTLESWFKVGWRVETVGGFAQKRDVSGYLEDWRGNRARVGRSGLRGADYPRAAQRRGPLKDDESRIAPMADTLAAVL